MPPLHYRSHIYTQVAQSFLVHLRHVHFPLALAFLIYERFCTLHPMITKVFPLFHQSALQNSILDLVCQFRKKKKSLIGQDRRGHAKKKGKNLPPPFLSSQCLQRFQFHLSHTNRTNEGNHMKYHWYQHKLFGYFEGIL